MISPFGGAVNIGKPWNVKWSHLNRLFCELKRLPMGLGICYISRFCVALSQDLEKSYKNHRMLRYSYKTGLAFLGEPVGKNRKPFGLRNLSRNGTLLVNTKRNFPAGKIILSKNQINIKVNTITSLKQQLILIFYKML